jgi:hypothetical protein
VRVRSFAFLSWLACSTVVASSALGAGQAAAADETPVEPSLTLQVDSNLVVGQGVPITATGTAPPGYSLWVLVDPGSTACPPDPTAQPDGSVVIVGGLPVGETFSVFGSYRPERTGQQSFCGYLRRSPTDAAVIVIEVRQILEPALPAAVARQTVEVALRRHGFAARVVDALETHCRRQGRTEFACRFKARFRGYRLAGRGRVQRRGDDLTYRFRVRAQGVRFVLTERNEADLA